MPTAIKRRRLDTKLHAVSARARNGLQSFTTTSKAVSVQKSIVGKDTVAVKAVAVTSIISTTTTRKRKLIDSDEEENSSESPASSQDSVHDIKPLPRRSIDTQSLHTPDRPVLNQSSNPSLDTPTKGARNLLDRFRISAVTPTRSPLHSSSSTFTVLTSSPASPAPKKPEAPIDLPIELLDLINLHAAFLTALSLHYAHNGTHAPADLRNICPDVARAWGKRSVTLEDVRRTIGVLNAHIPLEGGKHNKKISNLSLSNYGHGKICVEIKTSKTEPGRIARPVNEDLMNDVFVKGLVGEWERQMMEEVSMKEFVEGLPLEAITVCSSFVKMSPLLAKGQRRLEDLRAGMVNKESAKEKKIVPTNADGTKPTLLERLRAKQLHQSTLAPLPSKAEVARKAALGRIEEVVAVLTILSTSSSVGQQRISFTLPTVVGKLKDSFKTPMSREEADTCVRLLAAEIAPEWVRIVKMGKTEAVVVNRDERPTEAEVRERIKRAA